MNINIGYNALPNNSGRATGFGRRSSSIYGSGNNIELSNKLTIAKQIHEAKHAVVDISEEAKWLFLADFLPGEEDLTMGNYFNDFLKELAQSENGITGALEEIDESWFLKDFEGRLFSSPRLFVDLKSDLTGHFTSMMWLAAAGPSGPLYYQRDNISISQSFSNIASKFTEIRDLLQRNFTGAELDELLYKLDLAKEQAIHRHSNSRSFSYFMAMRGELTMLYMSSPDLWGRWSQLRDKLDEMREQLKEVLMHFGQLIVSFAIANGGFDPSRDAGRIGLNNDLDNIANDFRNSFFANL
ncbi:MAG: hypothetical protein FWG63_02085 [Defluviitaleaceae bacterium]|nr:hypothetical protein [Defluviitaleaceae bacterium]